MGTLAVLAEIRFWNNNILSKHVTQPEGLLRLESREQGKTAVFTVLI